MLSEGARLQIHVRVDGPEQQRPRLDVALECGAGVTAIMGPSGAGKSTLLQCIAGVLRPSAGRITLGDQVFFDSQARVLVPAHRRRVALVFQSLALFPHLRVWENVAYGLLATSHGARRRIAFEWLERVHAAHLCERHPETLSGGEAQRVALARALASEPQLLLLDEPLSALNRELRIALGDLLHALLLASGIPALLVTHDRADTERLATRILMLDEGRVVTDTCAEL